MTCNTPRTLRCDRTRVAVLWMTDQTTMVEIQEGDWPSITHGDDQQAARAWSELTGLTITIRTETQTTVEVRNVSPE